MEMLLDQEDQSILSEKFSPILSKILGEAETAAVSRQLFEDGAVQQFIRDWLDNGGTSPDIHKHPAMAPLFSGYLFQNAAMKTSDPEGRALLLAMSLEQYLLFLESNERKNIKYFAQWQAALVHLAMGCEWHYAEEMLMQSSNYDPTRSEAMKVVIQHYRETKEYGIAYMMSSIAVQQYAGKMPGTTTWFVDPHLYHWKLLNYHASICSKIQNSGEAKQTFDKIWNISIEHPEYFTEEQLQTLYQNQKAYAQ